MAAVKFETDAAVEKEIARLLQSDAVKLARLEHRLKNRRRQYMYQLRNYEKRGKALLADGATEESLREELLTVEDLIEAGEDVTHD